MTQQKPKPKMFSIYCDTYEHVKLLNLEERGELFTALYEYAINGIETDFKDGMLKMAFSFFRSQIKRNFDEYQVICERNRKIAKSRKSLNRHQSSPVVTTGNQENIIKEKIIKENNYNTPSTPVDSRDSFDYQSVFDSFNRICKSLPRVQKLNDRRRKAIKNAGKLLDGVSFKELFTRVEQSDFLTGRSGNVRRQSRLSKNNLLARSGSAECLRYVLTVHPQLRAADE